MNRREFSQFVALGAGSLGALTAGAEGAKDQPGVPKTPIQQTPERGFQPACVADYQALAQTVLPKATYEYISHGSTDQWTLAENVAAFGRIRFMPPLLHGVDQVETSTTVLGQRISLPILLAPTAAQNFYHPEGILASARAAATAGTILGVSSSAGHTPEEIAAVSKGPKWFQLYVPKDRSVGTQIVQRAEKAGFQAIIVTVDLGERKDADLRNRFALPPDLLRKHLRGYGFDIPDRMNDAEVAAFNLQAWDQGFTWKIFEWLRSITRLPLLIKGVLRADDARKAVEWGLDGIIVSNHGGRRLDGVPATIDQLAEVADAVAGHAEVFLDSGVRRGADAFKALALGAKAVLIGRPYVWALAAAGEQGVRHVLQLMQEELASTMHACGCADVASITPDVLLK
jgi:(S)-2-hydroxy-acid oxidase